MSGLGGKDTFDGLRGKKSLIKNPKKRGERMNASDLFSRDAAKGSDFSRVSKKLDEILADVKVDADPPVGSKFWVAAPSLEVKVGLPLRSKRGRSDLKQNDRVYCAGAAVWLDPPDHGTCRMPITMMPPNHGKQPVFWVTYYNGHEVDPMKRFCLTPVEDELSYFRVWLAHKYGKMLRGSDGMADTTWWFKFYMDLDGDRSNSVDMEEFQLGLSKFHYPSAVDDELAYERRANLLHLLDTDGSGDLSFEEFAEVLGIDPREIQKKAREFAEEQRIAAVRNAVSENKFIDEDVYVIDKKTGMKRYSMKKAYDKFIRKKDDASRTRTNNEAQRHTRGIYKNTDMQKAFKKWYDWMFVEEESSLWAKHPKIWGTRMKISPHDMHPDHRDYFGRPGLFNGEAEIDAQMERDAEPPAKRIPMAEEMALLREHLCELYEVDNLREPAVQRRIFDMMDDNGNGALSATEFTQALAHVVHYPPGPTTITTRTRRNRIFHTLDWNAKGECDFEKVRKGLFEGPVGMAELEAKKSGKDKFAQGLGSTAAKSIMG
ncbi:unnamed protein product [Amoebophrya sp. A25]|nr:unnamed protein product [Amoebophrya sp. A25]|eukprot:GSA25T00022509001.1